MTPGAGEAPSASSTNGRDLAPPPGGKVLSGATTLNHSIPLIRSVAIPGFVRNIRLSEAEKWTSSSSRGFVEIRPLLEACVGQRIPAYSNEARSDRRQKKGGLDFVRARASRTPTRMPRSRASPPPKFNRSTAPQRRPRFRSRARRARGLIGDNEIRSNRYGKHLGPAPESDKQAAGEERKGVKVVDQKPEVDSDATAACHRPIDPSVTYQSEKKSVPSQAGSSRGSRTSSLQ